MNCANSDLSIGQLVILIDDDGYMPPHGSYGEIVEGMDQDGDYGVLFPSHPCPNPPGVHWYAPRAWLRPITGLPIDEETREELTA